MNNSIPDSTAKLSGWVPQSDNSSALFEKTAKEYFEPYGKKRQFELDSINKHAQALNREATDVLDYQVIP